MSQTWISPYLQSGVRFVRRNGGKIALFTFATGSAIAAATYMRRQLRAVNESLEVERAEGARKLRSVFVANSQTIRLAFRALLPVARDILSSVDCVSSSPHIAKLREKPTDRKEKQELWEKVKLASVTHLLSAIYITSVLYSALSLQMNLLARYTNATLDAPVQALPSGMLSAITSKNFLDLARRNLLNRDRVEAITSKIEHIVSRHVQETLLTERMSALDIECMCANILSAIETDGPACASEEDSVPGEGGPEFILSTPQHWLFTIDRSSEESCGTAFRDTNYDWLMQESLDLCEILDFGSVIFSNASVVLAFALSEMKEELGVSEKRLPFAHLLPRFDAVASRIFPVDTRDHDNEGIPDLTETNLEVMLSGSEDSARFAASVFLSGEKENARQNRERASARQTQQSQDMNGQEERANRPETAEREVSISTEDLVTNISAPNGTDSDDLGLMFDIT